MILIKDFSFDLFKIWSLYLINILIKGNLGEEISVLRTFRMSGK